MAKPTPHLNKNCLTAAPTTSTAGAAFEHFTRRFAQTCPVTLRQARRFWLKLGCIGFGGPAGQIAIMHQELVERRRWISERRFLHALNYCMLLPGPEAQQLATYIGWLLHRTWGGDRRGTVRAATRCSS
jgi:hypothetical protein